MNRSDFSRLDTLVGVGDVVFYDVDGQEAFSVPFSGRSSARPFWDMIPPDGYASLQGGVAALPRRGGYHLAVSLEKFNSNVDPDFIPTAATQDASFVRDMARKQLETSRELQRMAAMVRRLSAAPSAAAAPAVAAAPASAAPAAAPAAAGAADVASG